MQNKVEFKVAYDYGWTDEVTPAEALAIRMSPELKQEYPKHIYQRVRYGVYWPYVGGVLGRKTNLTKEKDRAHDRRFVDGVFKLAFDLMPPETFNIFCEYNGVLPAKARATALANREVFRRDGKDRIRDILKRLGEGKSLYRAHFGVT